MLIYYVNSFCQSDIVTLVVGDGEEVFSVHCELLCARSEYFRGHLKGKFAEASSNSIKLQHPPHAVTAFLDWLYHDTINLSRRSLNYLLLLPIYVFADRICSDTYHNDLMDAIRRAHRDHELVMATETVVRLYESELQASQAAKFGMQSIVHDMVHNPDEWLNGKNAQGFRAWSSNVEVMVDMQKELWRAIGAKPEISPDELKGCVFHEHKGGAKCTPNKRKRE